MSHSVSRAAGARQPEPSDLGRDGRSDASDQTKTAGNGSLTGRSGQSDLGGGAGSESADLELDAIRAAVSELQWTCEAISAHMKSEHRRERSGNYIEKVLRGDKPMSLSFFAELPGDVRALYHEQRVEAAGRIVVAPVDFEQARRQLVSGLLGVLSDRGLPVRSTNQLKVTGAPGGVERRRLA